MTTKNVLRNSKDVQVEFLESRKNCIAMLDTNNTYDYLRRIIIELLFSLENLLEPINQDVNGLSFEVSPQIPYRKENVNSFSTTPESFSITVYAERNTEHYYHMLVVGFDYKNGIIYIPTIFVPRSMRYKGIGKKMIKMCYKVAKQFNCRVQIVDLVESFKERLLRRGAIPIGLDSVEITDTTDLEMHDIWDSEH